MTAFPIVLAAALAGAVSALSHVSVRRQVSEIRDSYDFVIAGGGTAGLTVADRLTEALSDKTVLVVEYGEIQYAPGVFYPPADGVSAWVFSSVPNPEMNNQVAIIAAGQVVDGSSSINGMYFDRPSRYDFEAWGRLNDAVESEDKWDWDEMLPYFQKSVTFTEPEAEFVDEYGYTWDLAAYGGSTPIYSSFPPFQWADHHIPNSQTPDTSRRSYSGLGHYAEVNKTRSNYDLFVRNQILRVVYPEDITGSGPPVVEVRSRDDDHVFNVTVNGEVILSAGVFHTPTILQRSGIGPASFLSEAEIPLVFDLPGVGSNLQDHNGAGLSWDYTEPVDFYPLPSEMENSDFLAEAIAQFDEVPARGPFTLALYSSAIYVSLPNVTEDYTTTVNRIRDVVFDGTAASYLPEDVGSDPRMVAGYEHQLSVLADFFENPNAASLEAPFLTGKSIVFYSLHTLSRGTVRLNVTHLLEQPILDYRTSSNPIDLDIHVAHARYLRKTLETPTMRNLGAVELLPRMDVQSDEGLIESIEDDFTFSFMHPCCTAAILPEKKGGVVGRDLRVHGADGLRIVDMSVLPLVPSSHLSALAYAVGENAADIIISHWSDKE